MFKFGKDIGEYVKVYNTIPNSVCDRAVSVMDDFNWQPHTFHNPHTNDFEPRSGDKELEYTQAPNKHLNIEHEIASYYYSAMKRYVTELDLDWFGGWTSFHKIRFNKYQKTRKMALHCDHIHTCFDGEQRGIPIFTILALLNDDYKGGEFYLWDKVIDMKKGDIILFPSVFLYPHKVEPVTEGVRYSCVSWAW